MLGIILYLFIIAAAWALAYYLGLLTGALYVPTDRKMVDDMLDLADLDSGDVLADLGSGDGRLVIAAAKRGIRSTGYEINPLLVWLSRRRAKKEGVADRTEFRWKSFWKADLSGYSAVTVFGIGHIMGRLERKLERELPSGSRVVCNLFAMPNWEGRRVGGLFVYRR